MTAKVIFNADDFGISRGVNSAIYKAYFEGVLNSASLMVNQKYVNEAVEMSRNMADLEMGLHINLTNEYPAANPKDIPLLVGNDGKLKNGFLKLLWLSYRHPKELAEQVEIEIRAQINKFLAFNLKLGHLDSHRHVHMIPVIFKVVRRLQKEYNVPRVRVMNEDALTTILCNLSNGNFSYLWDGGLVKYFILKTLHSINNYHSTTYFYTILYTCKISNEQFRRVVIPKGFDVMEVMIHPGMPDVDLIYSDEIWDENILSHYRTVELETLLNKDIVNGITYD